MNTRKLMLIAAVMLAPCLAVTANAQQTARDFPTQRSSQISCDNVEWNANMLESHPRLIDACQEVVVVDGQSWARFDVRFKEILNDGTVVFDVQNRAGRAIEQASFLPVAGQLAYIDNRATPFRELRTTDAINLYVPEGQYGFATQPGVPLEQVAQAAPATTRAPAARAPVVTDRAMAQSTTRQSVLPATSSPLPWLALAGFLSLLSGMVLTLRRWN